MQDDEKDKQIPISLRQFICYSKKAIQWKLRDFDEVKRFHDSHEFLPEDGNLLDAPSMQKYFNNGALESVFVFIRSDGKGEPMYIHREDLAQAIESLPSTEQDFLIKIFQEELPMSLYAAELGISTSMAYRRKKAILRKLSNAVTRGVDDKNMLDRDVRIVCKDTDANPFSGFLFCGDCGQPMVRKIVPYKKKKYYYFVCSTNRRHEGCSPHSISVRDLNRTVKNAISSHITHILNLSKIMEYIEKLPSANRLVANYETQIERLENEIQYLHKMKLWIYEDLTGGILDKQEYAEFREQYKNQIEEKESALERLHKEKKDTLVSGKSEKIWVALFRQYENIEELNRRILMALVDKILVYEGHALEVIFRYRDEYQRMNEFVKNNRKLLPQSFNIAEIAGV